MNQFHVAEHAVVCANLCEVTHTLRRILAIKPLLARWVRAFHYESMLRRREGRREDRNYNGVVYLLGDEALPR